LEQVPERRPEPAHRRGGLRAQREERLGEGGDAGGEAERASGSGRASGTRRTDVATCQPSAATPPTRRRPACSPCPRRSRARSGCATPEPATTSLAATSAATSRAPRRSTPPRPPADPSAPSRQPTLVDRI